ncbi:tRNA nucleotidyltransferase (CCA-adding enzyme) [Alteribacillus persepolensis]|uniref:tRNA nucleotidyltransferase (CCA-adding enzyme) n=1 Tax=Alteribacillus persepolensis TaxID=568899 RepID=A0A1G7ZDC1_9BACI|nr:CCA tRNA nucleotidyltransferase [Alteribacillus persepolensis]SDH06753.1 tRNA nucleotidyltransferase (CCA-adding enzyme) [Alteribacillus persepolensis]
MKDRQGLWEKALEVLNIITQHGFEAFIIGGAVRDFHLRRRIHDVDIATSASVDEMKTMFPKAKQLSKHFPTCLVIYQQEAFEVTTYRSENKTLTADLLHRDFTMNAMAIDRKTAIIDPFGGKTDIKQQIIRSVEPAKRFKEDPLRMIRAVRFMAQLDFSIEPGTHECLLKHRPLLEQLPAERVQAECGKLLMGDDHRDALTYLFCCDIPAFFPKAIRPVSIHARKHSYNYDMQPLITAEERWAAFLWLLYGKEAKQMPKKWRFSNRDKQKLIVILSFAEAYPETIPWNKQLIYQTGLTLALQVERLHQWLYDHTKKERFVYIQSVYRTLPITSREELRINGKDILATVPLIKKEKIGDVLRQLEHKVVEGSVKNDRQELVTFVKEKLHNER